MADLLLAHGAALPFHVAASLRLSQTRVRSILESGEPNERDPAGNAPLHLFAVGRGDPGVGEILVRAGADINAVNRLGATPLHSAVFFCNKSAVLLYRFRTGLSCL